MTGPKNRGTLAPANRHSAPDINKNMTIEPKDRRGQKVLIDDQIYTFVKFLRSVPHRGDTKHYWLVENNGIQREFKVDDCNRKKIIKDDNFLIFTEHASQRLKERTLLTKDEIRILAKNVKAMDDWNDKTSKIKLFWSQKDNCKIKLVLKDSAPVVLTVVAIRY